MEFLRIAVNKIEVGEHDQRAGLDDEAISELAVSIRRVGVLVPLVVSPAGDRFKLVAGHRRFAAAARVGLGEVPCVICEGGDCEQKEVAFAENLFRKDLSAVELACAINDAINSGSMKIPDVALGMHRTENWVAAQLAMLKWPRDVLEVIHDGKLSVSAASNLAMVSEDVYRAFLLRNAVEAGATARTTAAWFQAWRSAEPREVAIKAEPVAAGERATPAVPQAPCLCCGQVYRTDQLSHVPICCGCINVIRSESRSG